MKFRFLAVTAALALAACGGGGGGGSSPVNPPGAPTAPTGPTNTQQNPTASITIRIPIPSRPTGTVRRPQYVSPSTTSLEVKVNSVDTGSGPAAPPSWVVTDATTALTVGDNCTLGVGTETCTIPVPAPVGIVNYTFNATDGTNALSTFTGNETIVQGTSNALSATLEGVVHTVTTSPVTLAVQQYLGNYTQPIAVVSAYDADGNLIVAPGNYANPFTLRTPDVGEDYIFLELNGGPGTGNQEVVSSPSDAVSVGIYGGPFNSFNLTVGGSIPGGGTVACASVGQCRVTAGAPSDVVFSGTTNDDTAHGGLVTDPNYGQQTVYFSAASGTQTIGATEFGFTDVDNADGGASIIGVFNINLDPTSCGTGGSAVATVTQNIGYPLQYTVTAQNVGICKVQLVEAYFNDPSLSDIFPLTDPGHTANVAGSPTHDGTFWVSVTASSFGIDSHGRRPPNN